MGGQLGSQKQNGKKLTARGGGGDGGGRRWGRGRKPQLRGKSCRTHRLWDRERRPQQRGRRVQCQGRCRQGGREHRQRGGRRRAEHTQGQPGLHRGGLHRQGEQRQQPRRLDGQEPRRRGQTERSTS